jgi:hypothetical protein
MGRLTLDALHQDWVKKMKLSGITHPDNLQRPLIITTHGGP